jgi:hypothetical protein
MVGVRAARIEKIAQVRVILLASTHQDRDTAEANLSCLVHMVAATDWLWVGAEEQCECLIHELTLLKLMGSELYLTIIGAPL